MTPKTRKNLILFAILAIIAACIYPFEPSFSRGLFIGLGVAGIIYVIREFLPKRH
ncbi:MAG: hypothetical protein V7767_01120 [Leeuwenhoekiella sp.]